MADTSYMGGNTSTSYMGPGASYSPASLGTSPLYAVAPDERGEISKGWSRGVDNLQAMGYGAVGAVSDAFGNKDFAGKMYEGAQVNLAEAANSPAAVAQFTDIGGVGEAWDWFKGAAAEALPSSLAAFVAAGAVSATGGLAAPAVAASGIGGTIFKSAVNKLATDATAKAVVASAIEQQVAKGIAVEAAKKTAVKEFFKAELAANAKMIGAYAGGATAASAMETGSNWNEDVAKYGLADTSPLSDIGYGVAGGIVEAGLGAETRLATSMLRQKATEELKAAAKRGLARSIGRGVLAGSGSEAAEEGIQTALSAMSLARDPFTAQDPKEIFNSAMGGAAGGVLFGAASGTHSGLKGKAYKEMQAKLNPTTPEVDSDGNPLQQAKLNPTTPEVDSDGNPLQQANRTSNEIGVRQSIIQKQTTDQIATYEQQAQQINAARSQLTSAIIAAHNDPNLDQKTKEETIKQHENATMELSAQLSQLTKERSSFEEGSRKELEKLNKKMADLAIENQTHAYNATLYDTYTPEQKGKAAVLLTNIRGEADNELTKANLRIRQHQAALNALNKHYNQIMSEGGVVPTSYNAAVKFHENNIKDEQKFSAGITKQFEQDLRDVDDAVKNNARYTYPGRPTRDANAARNTIASFYESTAKSLQDTVVGKKDLRDKVAAKREHDISKSAFSKAYLAAVSESAKHNLNEYKKYEQDFNNLLIQDEIATGQLPGVRGSLPTYIDLTEAPRAIPGAISDSAEFTNAMVNPRVSGPAPSRNVDPAQYQNQVQRQRDAFKKQQVLGALAAWKAADNAKTATTEAATKQAQNLATMWNHMDIAQSSPIAAQSKQRVLGWITNTLDKLDALRDVVKLVHTSEISLLPDYVSKKYEAGDKGLIDLRTGTIYLFSDNINSKEDAVRTVLHEGVAHYGLRSIMSPEVLDKFLRLVHREFSSDARYKKIAERYSEAKSFEIAEEFIADLAERIHLSKVDMSAARRALSKVKQFIMTLLSKLGLVSVTRQDVDNVLLASVYYLSKRNSGLLKDAFSKHVGNNNIDAMNIKYDGFYSPLLKYVEDININPDKQMPLKYWHDQIWPKNNLRQGLSEEEMQYYDDMLKTRGGAFSSLKSWLSLSEDPHLTHLSKTEVLEYLDALNTVELEEHVIGDSSKKILDETREQMVGTYDNLREWFKILDADVMNKILYEFNFHDPKYARLSDIISGYYNVGNILYESWNNLRDAWNRAVKKAGVDPSTTQPIADALKNLAFYERRVEGLNNRGVVPYAAEYNTKGTTNPRVFSINLPIGPFVKTYSSHTDDSFGNNGDNLMWLRTSEFTDEDGKKNLLIEEIQSDRIQDGTTHGFSQILPPDNIISKMIQLPAASAIAKYRGAESIFEHELDMYKMGAIRIEPKPSDIMWIALNKSGEFIYGSLDSAKHLQSAIADGFHTLHTGDKSSAGVSWTPVTKSWAMLAMKRMIKFAADNGYDKIAWTPGNQQVERWQHEMRKNVRRIEWSKDTGYTDIILAQEAKDSFSDVDAMINGLVSDKNIVMSNTTREVMQELAGQPSDSWYQSDVNDFLQVVSSDERMAKTTHDVLSLMMKYYRKGIKAKREASNLHPLTLKVTDKEGDIREMHFDERNKYEGYTLEHVVGKATASKIDAEAQGSVEGDDLTIGGHGFTQFYDKELVNNTNKYIKKLDPSATVGVTPFVEQSYTGVNTWKLHSFDVTDAMKKRIEKGQPAYGNVIRARKDIDKVGVYQGVRGTPEYEKRFGFLRNWRKWLDRTTLAITPSGKIIGAEEVTPREKLATGLHDTFDRWGQLVHKVKESGGKVTNETNVSQIEKTTHNRIATNVGAFLKGVVGIDPGNWFARPEEGTLFFDMTKLIGTNKNIPSDPKQLLHTVGKVLQAMHAEEANLELVRKQHGTMVMGELNKKIDEAEAKKAAGTKTTEQMVKLEKELAKLYDMKEAVEKDIRRDLSGMSNEEAAEILGTYVTRSNEMLWNTISDKVQEINKKFLDTAVANNLLSPEMRAYWDKLYKNYVPLDVWEAHMSKVDPAFASMGRSFDMSMFELSKERTGKTGGLETNPLVLLTRKYTQLIQAIEQNRVTVSVYNLVKDNPEAMSEIVIIDDSLQAREFSAQYKELLKEADKVLGTRNITSMKQAMKDLRKRIAELRMDRSKAKLELRRRTSEDAKAKQADKITKIEMDIQSALDAIETMKADILDMRSRDDYKAVTTKMQELNKKRQALYNSRGYKVESRNGILTKVRKSSKFEGQSGNTVTAILPDGTKVKMLIKDVHLLAAIKGTSTMNPGLIVQALGKIQRVMAQLMTTYAPPFIVVNWVRDLSTGLIHMGNIAEDIKDLHWSSSEARSAFFSNVKRSVKAAYEYERNNGKISDPTMAQYMDLFRKNGGYTEMYGLTSYEATKKDMERALTTATNKGKAKDFMFAAANYMQDASSAVENSTRLAAFTAIYEALLKNNVDPAKAAQRAASAALDLTVNFTKRGTWSPVLASLFLFSQASINSTVRIAKAMFPASDHGKPFYQRRVFKYGHRLAIIGFIAAMAAKAIGGTDDDGVDFYDKLPAYVRSTNLVIAVGRNKFIRIPVTFGYQVMVNLGVVAADMLTGRATLGKATSTMWDSTIQNFSFVGGGDEGVTALTPTIFKPLVQVYANKNFFGGNVYPEAGNWVKGEKPDSQKYWANTSELAKKAAYWINLIGGGSVDRPAKLSMLDISPATMEHVFKQYLGGVGQFMLGTLEASEKLATGRTEKLTVDSLPILSRFGSHVDNAATMSEYTRVKKELETQVNEYKRAKATGTVQEVMQSTMAGRMLEKKLSKVQDKLADMKADLNKVELAKGSSAEEVYRKRIANEEKAAMLVKDLIRQARAAGVK